MRRACLDKDSANTGLYKHFKTGCSFGKGEGDLGHVTWTLVVFVETSDIQLTNADHQGSPKCRCTECLRLKDTEEKWIYQLGTFYGLNELNTRDEIKTRSRLKVPEKIS